LRFRATFQQSVEGIEQVEVFVEAESFEEAASKIELGEYERYRVLDNHLARIKLLGTAEIEQTD
jgi:hypothetical protein